jgi:hypothetical protein
MTREYFSPRSVPQAGRRPLRRPQSRSSTPGPACDGPPGGVWFELPEPTLRACRWRIRGPRRRRLRSDCWAPAHRDGSLARASCAVPRRPGPSDDGAIFGWPIASWGHRTSGAHSGLESLRMRGRAILKKSGALVRRSGSPQRAKGCESGPCLALAGMVIHAPEQLAGLGVARIPARRALARGIQARVIPYAPGAEISRKLDASPIRRSILFLRIKIARERVMPRPNARASC